MKQALSRYERGKAKILEFRTHLCRILGEKELQNLGTRNTIQNIHTFMKNFEPNPRILVIGKPLILFGSWLDK